jgi:hypothetical protein
MAVADCGEEKRVPKNGIEKSFAFGPRFLDGYTMPAMNIAL